MCFMLDTSPHELFTSLIVEPSMQQTEYAGPNGVIQTCGSLFLEPV